MFGGPESQLSLTRAALSTAGRAKSGLLSVIGLFLVSTSPGLTQAANDDYANRMLLTGADVSFTGTLAGATMEWNSGEVLPEFLNSLPSQTVRWQWTPAESATAIIQMPGCSKDPNGLDGVEVYTLENVNTGAAIAGILIDSRWPYCWLDGSRPGSPNRFP